MGRGDAALVLVWCIFSEQVTPPSVAFSPQKRAFFLPMQQQQKNIIILYLARTYIGIQHMICCSNWRPLPREFDSHTGARTRAKSEWSERRSWRWWTAKVQWKGSRLNKIVILCVSLSLPVQSGQSEHIGFESSSSSSRSAVVPATDQWITLILIKQI